MTDTVPTDAQKNLAIAWFAQLRDKICATFETIENELTGTHADLFE